MSGWPPALRRPTRWRRRPDCARRSIDSCPFGCSPLQDEERRRLALDLHDSTAQSLAALTMNLAMIKVKKTALDARSRRALTQSRSLAELCFGEVRTLAYLLHPPLLDESGLLSAVRWFAEGFSKRSGIQVVLDSGRGWTIAWADRDGPLPHRAGKSHERPSSRINKSRLDSSHATAGCGRARNHETRDAVFVTSHHGRTASSRPGCWASASRGCGSASIT